MRRDSRFRGNGGIFFIPFLRMQESVNAKRKLPPQSGEYRFLHSQEWKTVEHSGRGRGLRPADYSPPSVNPVSAQLSPEVRFHWAA